MVNTREVAAEYRLSQWARIVQERINGGLSIREYCKQIGICENTYFYWQRRLREVACQQLTAPGFVEVAIQEPPTPPALPAHVAASAPSQLSVEVAGVRITADSEYPPEQLAALLRELTRPC